MSIYNLPGVEMLENTPEILRNLICELDEEDSRWKPAPDRFSVAEVLGHLSHAEGHCYRARLDRFLKEDHPAIEPYDPNDYLEIYRKADAEDSLDHFEDQRQTNLDVLCDLPAEIANRKAKHPRVGEITLGEMLNEWVLHDLGHIRQLAELVRARKYLAGAGPLGHSYQLKP